MILICVTFFYTPSQQASASRWNEFPSSSSEGDRNYGKLQIFLRKHIKLTIWDSRNSWPPATIFAFYFFWFSLFVLPILMSERLELTICFKLNLNFISHLKLTDHEISDVGVIPRFSDLFIDFKIYWKNININKYCIIYINNKTKDKYWHNLSRRAS